MARSGQSASNARLTSASLAKRPLSASVSAADMRQPAAEASSSFTGANTPEIRDAKQDRSSVT